MCVTDKSRYLSGSELFDINLFCKFNQPVSLVGPVTDYRSGLAISDFLMAINFLSSSARNLSGSNNIGNRTDKGFCSFNGFAVQTFVVQSKYLRWPPRMLR